MEAGSSPPPSKSPRGRAPTTSLPQSPRDVWSLGNVKTSSLMDWQPGKLRGSDTRSFYGMLNGKAVAAPLLRRRVTESTKGEQALVTAICNNRRQNPKSLPPNLSPTDAWSIAKGQKLPSKIPSTRTVNEDEGSEAWSWGQTPRQLRQSSLTAMVRLRRSANIPFVPAGRKTILYVHRVSGEGPVQTTPRLPINTPPQPTTLSVQVYLPKLEMDVSDGTDLSVQ